MYNDKKLDACIDYLMSIASIEHLKELTGGFGGGYALEMRRIDAHVVVCELFEIERKDALHYTNDLSKWLDLDLLRLNDDVEYRELQGKKLYQLLDGIKKFL